MSYPKDEVVVEATPNYVRELKYLNDRLDRVNKRIGDERKMFRLLVRILVDKKVIGEELAKTFEETQSNEELLDWFLNKDEKKEGE